MGKIGDLFVRLGLKSEDYKKGINEAKKQTDSFGLKLGKMKAGAVAVWAAVGASALKFAKDVIAATNRTGDAWAMFVAKSKAGWDSFLKTLSSWNWENWTGKIREARAAAEELQSALDAEYEIRNSINLQKAAMAEELANLQILMRDVSKPWAIRKQAAEDYLATIKPIYEQEKVLANKLLDAYQGKWLKGTGLTDNEQTRNDLAKFLVDYGKIENAEVLNALAFIREYQSAKGTRKRNVKAFDEQVALAAQYNASKDVVRGFEQSQGYKTSLIELSKAYENLRGDQETTPLVNALINSYNSQAAEAEETRKVRSVINQAEAAAQAEIEQFNATLAADMQAGLEMAFEEIENFDDSFADIELEIPPIDTTNLDKSLQEIQEKAAKYRENLQFTQQISQMFADTVQSAMSDGLQSITDMMFGLENANMSNVAAALLMPFGNMAKQMGALVMSYGLSMDAFKKAFAVPEAAIAAGAGLMAIGAAITSGARRISEGNLSMSSAGTSYGGNSVGNSVESYESTLTVEVVGKISGNDINIVGKKAANSKNR